MSDCPCGTSKSYDECCAVYHRREQHAKTAETLMRARYAAYVLGEIDYVVNTIPPLQRKTFDRKDAKEWSKNSVWSGLEILSTKGGLEGDKQGTIEFRANFKQGDEEHSHHEISKFVCVNDRWFFVDGRVVSDEDAEAPEISRSAPCPCGSGKKYKKCCAA